MTILCLLLFIAFETTEILRIASSPSVQFLTPNTFAERGFVTYTIFVFATCKFATCIFSPPNMIKEVLKCTCMSTFKCLI